MYKKKECKKANNIHKNKKTGIVTVSWNLIIHKQTENSLFYSVFIMLLRSRNCSFQE